MYLTYSKGDQLNRRGDVKVFRLRKNDPNNPYDYLCQIARMRHPGDKYVFQKQKIRKADTLIESNKYYKTPDLVYHLGQASKECNYKTKYTGHSARNAMVSTLTLAGASDDAMRIFLNWAGDSTMTHYYRRHILESSSKGCAAIIDTLINSNKIIDLQKKLMY